jgi:glycosyltransferase involved in cell wall biosynthesis
MKKQKLKLLLVAYQFPPYSNVGSLRIGKFAKFMEAQGHDLTVLTADKIMLLDTMDLEIDPARIFRTKWLDVNLLPRVFFGGREKVIKKGYTTKLSLVKRLGDLYRLITNFPDERIGWLPYAIVEGNKLLANGDFDFIYASSPTPTSLIIANHLSSKWKVPWLAEYRDPWADPVHYDFPEWRRKLEKRLEKRVLKNVSGIITISDPLAEEFRSKFKKPAITSMNGFASEDVQDIKRQADKTSNLEVVYTGAIHYKIVHLEPLFEAISKLGENAKRIHLNFYTRYIEGVLKIAEKFGVEAQVIHKGLIPYLNALEIQRNADILLFLNPHKYGIITTKIYEYIAALRPVLAVGDKNTTAGEFIQGLGIGLISEDPVKISNQLKKWLDMKKNMQEIPDNPISKRAGFSREKQFEKIEDFLISLIPREKK